MSSGQARPGDGENSKVIREKLETLQQVYTVYSDNRGFILVANLIFLSQAIETFIEKGQRFWRNIFYPG